MLTPELVIDSTWRVVTVRGIDGGRNASIRVVLENVIHRKQLVISIPGALFEQFYGKVFEKDWSIGRQEALHDLLERFYSCRRFVGRVAFGEKSSDSLDRDDLSDILREMR